MTSVYASSPLAHPALQMRIGVFGPGALDDLRNDLGRDVIPHRRVAEKTGDVDQDRVEQVGEFLGVNLEVVDVAGVVLDVDRLHPLVDAPDQAGTLVPAKIKAAGALEVIQQRFEIGSGIRRRFTHGVRLAGAPR
jgi:hypothetical protein